VPTGGWVNRVRGKKAEKQLKNLIGRSRTNPLKNASPERLPLF